MEWIPLGTNGFFPSFGRETMAFLLLADEQALLLDAGTGVGRLTEPALADRLAGCRRLDVLLTHYHLDHVVGLACLPALWRGPLRVHAPDPPLVDAPARESLDRLVAPPFFPRRFGDVEPPIEVLPYSRTRLEVGAFALRLRRQRHAGGSVGVRVGSVLAYATDTEVDESTAELARGVHTLLHEVWWSDAEAAEPGFNPGGHSWSAGVANLASRAGVGRLVPVHHHPRRSPAELEGLTRELAATARCEVLQVVEGQQYREPDSR